MTLDTRICATPRALPLRDIAGPYIICRGWRDGEPMMQHLVERALNSVAQAEAHMARIGGGYIVRTADGATYRDGQWIDDEGLPLAA